MSEFFVQRRKEGLLPQTMEDAAVMAKLPYGKPILITAKVPRNGKFHSLYWVLCARIGNAVGLDAEIVSDTLKIASGHCETIKSKSYGTLRLPKSISFANMDETSFRAFFEKCIQVIYAEWGIERSEVVEAVSDILTPTEANA